jgi:hypothetical protein
LGAQNETPWTNKMSDCGIKCDYCSWNGRSSRYPWHMITKHLAVIYLHPNVSGHYVCAHSLKGREEKEFLVCLTCKGGTASSPLSVVGDRWSSAHDKRRECKDAHSAAYTKLKDLWKAARESAVTTSSTAAVPVDEQANMETCANVLWETLKKERKLAGYMLEVEKRLKEDYLFDMEDSDCPTAYVFDPATAFLSAMAEAMSLRKEVHTLKKHQTEVEMSHHAELTVHRDEIINLRQYNTGLRETVTEQAGSIQDLYSIKSEQNAKILDLETNLESVASQLSTLTETSASQAAELASQAAELIELRAKLEQLSAQSPQVCGLIFPDPKEPTHSAALPCRDQMSFAHPRRLCPHL